MGRRHADGCRSVCGGDEVSNTCRHGQLARSCEICDLEQQLAEAKECLAWAFGLAEGSDSYWDSTNEAGDRKWSVRCKKVLK